MRTKNVGPIHLPGNPLWSVCKTFGGDQIVSFLFDFTGTLLMTHFLSTVIGASLLASLGISSALVFSCTGPIVEKIGFFPIHFYEAWDDYRTTAIEDRGPFNHYFKEALHGGAKSFAEDIAFHDPIYVATMYFGLRHLPDTPPWILCVVCFFVAVFIVACLETGFKEILSLTTQRKLQKFGFDRDGYYEARFTYSDEARALGVFRTLVEKYLPTAGEPKLVRYHDRYFGEMPWWNGRKLQLRSRERDGDEGKNVRTWQVISTLASEQWKRGVDQYRYFVSWKEKLYLSVPDGSFLGALEDIPDASVRAALSRYAQMREPVSVSFERLVSHHPDSLLVSFDRVPESGLFIIEIKARGPQKGLMREAMKYALSRGGAQTTKGKFCLITEGLVV